MTFEEKFRNKWLEVFKDACRKNEEEVIKNWLDKNCIDKQRVREVIEALRNMSEGWISGGCDAEYCMECFDDKVKELGL